jgi:multidrug efflux system outer membrane protein
LSDLRLLGDQTREQNDAVNASKRAEHLSQTQYQEGQVAYLDVIDAERQTLQSQLQLSHLAGTQAVATVNLIRALGGGWGDVKADVGSADGAQSQQVAKQ